MSTPTEPTAHPCATCPWLKTNHGKPHKAGWYTTKNLRRLWRGVRAGEQMICHATDPESINYGGDKPVAPDHQRLCVGQLILVMRSIQRLERSSSFAAYRAGDGIRMTRIGMANWAWHIMTRGALNPLRLPAAAEGHGIGVPWLDPVLNGEEDQPR